MTGPSTKPGQNTRAPSSPAYGAVVALTVILAATIVLTYTMLQLPGQRELGGLNYMAAVALLVVAVILVKRFRPARVTDEDPSATPHVRR
jgi:hypothetical protein